jgi:archaellum biogenesis protein FlaJ (TadC family)
MGVHARAGIPDRRRRPARSAVSLRVSLNRRLPAIALSIVNAVIPGISPALFSLDRETQGDRVMRRLFKLLIPLSFMVMASCVVAPYGYHRGYYAGPRVAIIAPAPVLVVR